MKQLKSMDESYNKKYKSINYKLISYESKFNVLNTSLNGMLTAINKLNEENSPHPDLFNPSLLSGCFSDQWKPSFIYPVFKSGNRNTVRNYRPISQLSSLPKMFEKLLVPTFTTVFDKVISENQHGFRHSKSTMTNLLVYYIDLISSIKKDIQVDAVYTDIRKAFDSVDLSILVEKLKCLGVVGQMLSWLKSYLDGRTQQVKLGNFISSAINVTPEVPQGWHLSPILFTLFINEIKDIFKSRHFLILADDLKLYRYTYLFP